MGQLPLSLGHRAALGREDFVVADCNAAAVAWLDQWPRWPAPALLLMGPPGCGKSHLAGVFAARTGAPVLSAPALEQHEPPALLGDHAALVIDDVDAREGAGENRNSEGTATRSPARQETRLEEQRETCLFHLYNLAREQGRSLLLTCQQPPARWIRLPDLRSRLSAAPLAEIGPPDDTVMAAVLVKLFADRQIRIGGDVITWLLRHMERSYQAACAVVEAADLESLARRRPVTVPLVRQILGQAGPDLADEHFS